VPGIFTTEDAEHAENYGFAAHPPRAGGIWIAKDTKGRESREEHGRPPSPLPAGEG